MRISIIGANKVCELLDRHNIDKLQKAVIAAVTSAHCPVGENEASFPSPTLRKALATAAVSCVNNNDREYSVTRGRWHVRVGYTYVQRPTRINIDIFRDIMAEDFEVVKRRRYQSRHRHEEIEDLREALR